MPPFVARPTGSSGAITQLQLNKNVAPAPVVWPVHFIDLAALSPADNRPADPSLFGTPDYQIADQFRRSGMHITDGWMAGDALVAQVDLAGSQVPSCSQLRNTINLPAAHIVLVSSDWNPLETCSNKAIAQPVAADVAQTATTPGATQGWQPNTIATTRRSIEEQQLVVQA